MKRSGLVLIFFISSFCMIYSQLQTYKSYITTNTPKTAEIDIFLNNPGVWAQFDPQLGYILGNSMPHDGRDNNYTISTVQKNGARTQINYKSKSCRINVFGDSFAQCHQVSDGETWEELLAANYGEPIRNFGMGGYGTYQSYRRLIKEETGKNKVENILFYIWGDDHQRSLLQTRYMAIKAWNDKMDPGFTFHGNFWPYMDFDLNTGKFTEHDNKLNTRKLLYKMTDSTWMYSTLKDNLALQMLVYIQGYTSDFDTLKLKQLAKWMDVKIDFDDKTNLKQNIGNLLDKFGYAANLYILDKLKTFAKNNNKNLMVIIFDPYKVTYELMMSLPRTDQLMLDYLQKEKFNYFDMNVVHAEDFKKGNLTISDYYAKYLSGHYDVNGNRFFASAIKGKIVDWLNPKPITYRNNENESINFKGYLQGIK